MHLFERKPNGAISTPSALEWSHSVVMPGSLSSRRPGIGAGRVAAVIDQELPMSQAAQAHRAVAASDHIGKILLRPE
jgi:NADPH:quinone reductase-like Zn-dependent oxidoreductase